MKIIAEIYQNGEYLPVNDKYEITRQGSESFSKQWELMGAVRFNNFGYVVETMPVTMLKEHIKDWQYKNGKQKWFIRDYDHGTHRIWMNPTPYYMIWKD